MCIGRLIRSCARASKLSGPSGTDLNCFICRVKRDFVLRRRRRQPRRRRGASGGVGDGVDGDGDGKSVSIAVCDGYWRASCLVSSQIGRVLPLDHNLCCTRVRVCVCVLGHSSRPCDCAMLALFCLFVIRAHSGFVCARLYVVVVVVYRVVSCIVLFI